MTSSPSATAALDCSSWDLIDCAVSRLEEAWSRGGQPKLGELLPPTPDPLRERVLVELIKVDQEHRFRTGRQKRLESYIQEWPELAGKPECVAELLNAECLTRAIRHEAVTDEELRSRFPAAATLVDLTSIAAEVQTERESASLRSEAPSNRVDTPRELQVGTLVDGKSSGTGVEPIVRLFGRYEIRSQLGRGGMGTVYRAFDTQLGREVALKVPKSDLVADRVVLERFLREARAAAAIRHPNVCPIYDVGEIDGTYYISMALVEGQSLAARLKRGPLPPREAAEIVRRLALALNRVHAAGLIHRDIKPSNVMIDEAGDPLLTDFGLVRPAGPQADQHLTTTGSLLGTPGYMSPEQVSGGSATVDARTDIYSLGVLLYQALTGKLPFDGPLTEVLVQITHFSPPLLRSIEPELDPLLEGIVLKAMARRREDRYQTACELCDALGRWLTRSQIVIRPAPTVCEEGRPLAPHGGSSTRSVPTTLAAVARRAAAAAALLIAGALLFSMGEFVFKTKHGTLVVNVAEPGVQVVIDGEQKLIIDSKKVGRVELVPGEHQVLLKRGEEELYTKSFTLRRGGEVIIDVSWQTREAAAPPAREASIPVAPAVAVPSPLDKLKPMFHYPEQAGGQPAELVAVLGDHRGRNWSPIPLHQMAYSPDGQTIATGGTADGYVRLWDVNTGEERLAFKSEICSAEAYSGTCVAFVLDGKTLATGGVGRVIRLWDIARDREKAVLSGHQNTITALAPSPDRLTLASASLDHTVKLWDLVTMKERATLVGHTGQVYVVAFAPDGKTVASASQDETIKLWDAVTGEERATLRGHSGAVVALAFSPDSRIVASVGVDRTVRLWDIETAAQRSTLADAGESKRPLVVAFSPDGRSLVTSGGDGVIRVWDPNSGEQRFAFEVAHWGEVDVLAYSPDGQTLAVGGVSHVIDFFDTNTGKVREPRINPVGDFKMALAPNSRTLATVEMKESAVRIWDLTAATEQATYKIHHPTGIGGVSFSPDSQLVASAGLDHIVKVWDAVTGRERAIFTGHTNLVRTVAFTPDGLRVASAGDDQTICIWDAETGKEAMRWPALSLGARIHALAFAPDGHLLASANWRDSALRIWDAATGEQRATFDKQDANGVSAFAFTPDSKTLAVTYEDGSVRLWDVASWQERFVGRGHQGPAFAVAFAPDGKSLYTAGLDGRIIHWLSFFDKREWLLPGPVHRLALAADGRHLVTYNGNGTVYVLRVNP